ncbi:hypothetical protein [Dokdonia donghaensis]|uniref:Uncharacterized protein n=1 Tax=Dokdonia donghaensis DSW-1 TaxID=1300343 RepID=A0A0A2GT97_9FLAO|nr:hypothetical protein [Dokdonia donghaensis]ANH59065.1 hypothetical protein I597_0130 [Dokdonia donghaensis DSW-1]KGO06494.1 hypothetical protein NV36_06345 [Dokdonia donghaensis DSW-1]
MKHFLIGALCLIATTIYAQDIDDNEIGGSVIQTLTPSKLIAKGQYDIKWFNNLYTQTESTFTDGDEPRQSFFTSSLEAFTGVSENRRLNVGVILEVRSNVIGGRDALDVFSFDGERGTARSGLTSIAPAVKFVPFASVNNFSIQSSLSIPLIDQETEQGVFLDQKGFTWQNRFFFDHTFAGGDWQVFAELNSEFNFGKEAEQDENFDTLDGSFANNSLNLTPGVFLSYFPSAKFTVLGLVQHSQRIDLGNDFEQDFTAVGGGAKYQLTDELNLEALYTNFVRGNNTGLGETFNLGLRVVF